MGFNMTKVILVHANCSNSKAKGDFSFAGMIARDIFRELQKNSIDDVDVVLVSTHDGVSKFDSLYGPAVNGRVSVEDTNIGLFSLETFDAIKNTVLAFIDANRCKYSAGDIVKRVLSPESKLMFVGNVNDQSYSNLFIQELLRAQLKEEQPGLYEPFSDRDLLLGAAGFGADRFGIPTIAEVKDLPSLSSSQSSMLLKGNYGFMYLARLGADDFKLIAQYIKLSAQCQYVLVGDFVNSDSDIKAAFMSDASLITSQNDLPPIQYYQSLPNGVMRRMMANTTGSLVLTTGTTSTLEAMRDNKLPYYQNMYNNAEFVAAYLTAVKTIISSDTSLVGCMPGLIMDLSNLLFASKPLSKIDMERTHALLEMPSVCLNLVATNQIIIEQASGKIAPLLLGFLNGKRNTKDHVQLATVCASLRKTGEKGTPVYDQALRRAASWGRLFELKVLIKSMPTKDLDKKDPTYQRSALHWAVLNKNYDCACFLVQSGVSLNVQDIEGRAPLHYAIINADKQLIEMLIKEGASLDIRDNSCKNPTDSSIDDGIILFARDCQASDHSKRC